MTPLEPSPPNQLSVPRPAAPPNRQAEAGKMALSIGVSAPLLMGILGAPLASVIGLAGGFVAVAAVLIAMMYYVNRALRGPEGSPGKKRAILGLSSLGLWGIAFYWLFDLLGRSSGSCGRPFRVRGRRRQALAQRGEAWLTPRLDPGPLPSRPHSVPEPTAALASEIAALAPATRAWLSHVWLRDAAEEHASIAAFAQLSLELIAVGAPPDLLSACHAAALDEVRHATHGYRLASLYGDRPWSPQALPEAAQPGRSHRSHEDRLVHLAVDSLRDGCLNEGWAAEQARQAAAAAHPQIAPVLLAIADDEQRHAELAWQILAFCLAQGGAPVAAQVAHATAALPARAVLRDEPPSSTAEDLSAYRRAGRLSPDALRVTYEDTRAAVSARARTLLQATCGSAVRIAQTALSPQVARPTANSSSLHIPA